MRGEAKGRKGFRAQLRELASKGVDELDGFSVDSASFFFSTEKKSAFPFFVSFFDLFFYFFSFFLSS